MKTSSVGKEDGNCYTEMGGNNKHIPADLTLPTRPNPWIKEIYHCVLTPSQESDGNGPAVHFREVNGELSYITDYGRSTRPKCSDET